MTGEIRTVAVIGLGTMGAGIAEVFAAGGYQVLGFEPDADGLARGRGHLGASLSRQVAKGRLSEAEQSQIEQRVSWVSELEALSTADLVIEAVPEIFDLKTRIIEGLDKVLRPDAIIATNTSSLSVTSLAQRSQHPQRVVGMHFFNPAPVQRLVEVVTPVTVDPQVVDRVADLARAVMKTPVVVGDRAGFIVNNLLFSYLNHAVALVDQGRMSGPDLDEAMKYVGQLPMGPIALLDLVGLDTSAAICEVLYQASKDPLLYPNPRLTELVSVGCVGRKAKQGFYDYRQPNTAEVVTATPTNEVWVIGDGPQASAWVQGWTQAGVAAQQAWWGPDGELLDTEGPVSLGAVDLFLEASGPANQRSIQRLQELVAAQHNRPVVWIADSDVPLSTWAAGASDGATWFAVSTLGFDHPAQIADRAVYVRHLADADQTQLAHSRSWLHGVASSGPVVAGPDRDGDVVEALLAAHLNDAARMVDSGYATTDDVDTAMKLGCGYRVGPFELLHQWGPQRALAAVRRLHAKTSQPGHAPSPLLVEMAHLATERR